MSACNDPRRPLTWCIALLLLCMSMLQVARLAKFGSFVETTTSSISPKCSTAPMSLSPFKSYLSKFDYTTVGSWTNYELETFFKGIQEFNQMEPLVPVNTSCSPPPIMPLPDDTITKCPGPYLKQQPRNTTAKVAHAIQFGFDVDTLEVLLHELYDVVDRFFIVEMVLQHNKVFPSKTLTWDQVKQQRRFQPVRDKVVHIVLDDVDVAKMKALHGDPIWETEDYQEYARWTKIMEWNNAMGGYFRPTDIIGFGDTDEIPARRNIHLLKHCEFTSSESIDIGIWFPYGRIDQAFATDFPVSRQHPYTLGDPTYFTFQSATNYQDPSPDRPNKFKCPSRRRGKSSGFLLGGFHMSHYGYLPYQLVKKATVTEAATDWTLLRNLTETIGRHYKEDTLVQYEEALSLPYPGARVRIKKLWDISPPRLDNATIYLPWFYDCNRDRYPRWEGKLDTRLGL